MEKASSREGWVQLGMYRRSSRGHSCQAWLQLVESHRKQVRLEERNRDGVCGREWFFGWRRASSPLWRSEQVGNRLLHERPREPGCPTFKTFAAPAVPTPVFWVRWKTGKRERSEHRWKSKRCHPPLLRLVLQAGQGKPVSVHTHSHPNASHRKPYHQMHNKVHAVFSIFHSWPQVDRKLEAAPVVHAVEGVCVKGSSLQGAELSD